MLHELLKHLKNVNTIIKDKNSGFTTKIRGFFVEILIIVIAVSLSIFFHNLNEEIHKQAETKENLNIIKYDLKIDIARLDSSMLHLFKQIDTYDMLIKNERNTNIKHIVRHIFYFSSYRGGYENLLYSGLFSHIKDMELRGLLFEYYTDRLDLIKSMSEVYENNNDYIFNIKPNNNVYNYKFFQIDKIAENKNLVKNNLLKELVLTKKLAQKIQIHIDRYSNK